MKINIYGSTGEIGSKSIHIIHKFFPKIKFNLFTADTNYKKLIIFAKKYKPNYICLNNKLQIFNLERIFKNTKTKVIHPDNLIFFLNKSKSDLSILSISGYQSLNLLESILANTKNLGLVNKECIVSAGHLFKKLIKDNKVTIYPLDSEHYSLDFYFRNLKKFDLNFIKKIYLTASGGPFFKTQISNFKNISFNQAIKHPKWKMGYKNSIDSATLANKCLELIEAYYLFNIPYNNMDIIIHPESLVHSIIEFNNFNSSLNYFIPDMFIPIFNFLNNFDNPFNVNYQKNIYDFKIDSSINFFTVDKNRFPIYKIFNNINKNSPSDIIKFNTSNEVAVDNFKFGKIKFNKIPTFIEKSLSLDFTHRTNSINNIIKFQNYFKHIINDKYI